MILKKCLITFYTCSCWRWGWWLLVLFQFRIYLFATAEYFSPYFILCKKFSSGRFFLRFIFGVFFVRPDDSFHSVFRIWSDDSFYFLYSPKFSRFENPWAGLLCCRSKIIPASDSAAKLLLLMSDRKMKIECSRLHVCAEQLWCSHELITIFPDLIDA